MNKTYTLLGIIGALILITGAVYRFDYCKVNETAYAEDMAKVSADLLEIQRRNLVQRMVDMRKAYPQTYHQMPEYQTMEHNLKMIDIKLQAIYKGKG